MNYDQIKKVLSENYLSAFGLASTEVHERFQGKRNDLTLCGFEWPIFKRNILDHFQNTSPISSEMIKKTLYLLCGSSIYLTDPDLLDSTLTSIKIIVQGGLINPTKRSKSATTEPNINDLTKRLKEWTAVCSNRVIKRLPKGLIVSPDIFKVHTSNLEFATECIKTVIDGYSTHKTCLLAIDEYCKRTYENFNLSSFLQRLIQCILSNRVIKVAFLSGTFTKKTNDSLELKICSECCIPVNVYMKPKFANNNPSTDDIMETVKYN